MKTKLIRLKDKFILVSDEDIKEGDYGYSIKHNIIFRCDTVAPYIDHSQRNKKEKVSLLDDTLERSFEIEDCIKIIAGIPELPSIDFSDLKEEDCKEIGYIDVEKLSYNFDTDKNSEARKGFIEGFKTAQSLNDKMFSLEDMHQALHLMNNSSSVPIEKEALNIIAKIEEQRNDIIQSLQQTEWDVEVEMEESKCNCIEHEESDGCFHCDYTGVDFIEPKITGGKIKVLKIL